MQPLDCSFSKLAEFFPVLRYLEQNRTVYIINVNNVSKGEFLHFI